MPSKNNFAIKYETPLDVNGVSKQTLKVIALNLGGLTITSTWALDSQNVSKMIHVPQVKSNRNNLKPPQGGIQ